KLAAAQTVAAVEAGAWTVSLGDLLGPRFAAEPARMFSFDRFHPSADGYPAAAAVMLPTALAALGTVDPRVLPAQKVRSLPRAAAEASRHAGTEVSASSVAGDRRGPGGRWALLRRPTGSMLWRRVVDMVRQRGPDDMVRQHGPDDMVRQRGPDDMVRQRGPDDRETTTATGRTDPTGRMETDDGAGTAEQLERR